MQWPRSGAEFALAKIKPMCEDARTATKENLMPSYRDMLALPHDPLIGEALRDESLRRARAEYAEACRKLRRDPALTAFETGDHTPLEMRYAVGGPVRRDWLTPVWVNEGREAFIPAVGVEYVIDVDTGAPAGEQTVIMVRKNGKVRHGWIEHDCSDDLAVCPVFPNDRVWIRFRDSLTVPPRKAVAENLRWGLFNGQQTPHDIVAYSTDEECPT